MGTIRTVTGDIDAAQLSVCYAHEHLLIRGGPFVKQDPDFLLDDRTRAAQDLATFTALGGRSLVDMMPSGLGRDPDGLRALSTECGVSIIAATGFHVEKY